MERGFDLEGRPTWTEVSLGAILHNLRLVRKQVGRRKILAVVKANAYGLGAVEISKALARARADWFGVTSTEEGIELREAGIRQPILLLTGFWPGEETRATRYNLTPTVTRVEQLRALEKAAASRRTRHARPPIGFHLKINTGMNRLGIAPREIGAFTRGLVECPHLKLEGAFTHFASADDFTNQQTEQQEKTFHEALTKLRANGFEPGIVHMANSAAICARPSTWADMVRPGAILYGYHQSFEPPEYRERVEKALPLRPCLSLRTRIISLREMPAGQAVGYGARYVAERSSRVAVIAIGYADGLVRGRSNRGCALVHGRAVPIIGTISMDLAAIDVTGVPQAKVGDVVTIYGTDGPAEIRVSHVARELGTVTSDLLCALGARVPRLYVP